MGSSVELNSQHVAEIGRCVALYTSHKKVVETVAETVYRYFLDDSRLSNLVHSIKFRAKAPSHLEHKLRRKYADRLSKGKEPDVTSENMFVKISDLAGVRILHVRPSDIQRILPEVLRVLSGYSCVIAEKPFAYTWDDEAKEMFKTMGVRTKFNKDLYTSTHLVTKFNKSHFCKCEIQIRTLIEEVWGEVSHQVNYPDESSSVACREQLRVLAKISAGGTRLVDSIFASRDDYASMGS